MSDQAQKSGFFKRHKLLTIVFVTLLLGTAIMAISDSSKPKYEAKAQNFTVTDPSTLRVDIKVHNVGEVSGKPNCSIEADNGTRSYRGTDRVVSDTELKPDGYWGFAQTLTITNEGAEYVDQVTVTCK